MLVAIVLIILFSAMGMAALFAAGVAFGNKSRRAFDIFFWVVVGAGVLGLIVGALTYGFATHRPGEPVDSLEPGTYVVYNVHYDYELDRVSMLIAEQVGTDENGVPQFGEEKFVRIRRSQIQDGSIPFMGTNEVTTVTECHADDRCVTRHQFTSVGPCPPVRWGMPCYPRPLHPR